MLFPDNWFGKITPLIDDRGFTIVGSISQMHRIPEKQDPDKLILYNWDVYPWFDFTSGPWKRWGEYMKKAREVWHSSLACAKRTEEIYGFKKGQVIKTFAPVEHFEGPIADGNYVLMPMRYYHNDKCFNWATNACHELKIKLIWPNHDIPEKQYREIMRNCTLVLSHYYEASTGGLGMIEGTYLGKTVVANGSPYNGAREYMGDHAAYFQTYEDLKDWLQVVFDTRTKHDLEAMRKWVKDNYDIKVMAEKINASIQAL